MDGKNLIEMNIRAKFGVNVVTIKSREGINIAPKAEDTIQSGDILVVIGHSNDLKKLEEKVK